MGEQCANRTPDASPTRQKGATQPSSEPQVDVRTSRPAVLVGAYACLPASPRDQETFYADLAGRKLADGLEIPFRDELVDDPQWLADQMRGRFTQSVLTLIPGTMINVGAYAKFGLASPDPDGRRAALDHFRRARCAAEELNQLTGEQSVDALHIHTAPSKLSAPEMFARSLEEVLSSSPADGSWSTRVIVEHCDAYSPGIAGEKRFLSLEEEMSLALEAGVGMTINWGRSVIEAHDPDRALSQIRALVEAGLLEGIMFSGAGPSANQYGDAWADAHLPLAEDEPTSLLDSGEVRRCLLAAGSHLSYAGAKIQAPGDATVEKRLDMVGRITRIVREEKCR